MNTEIINKKLRSITPFLFRYRYIIGSLTVLAIFSFVVLRIDSLAGSGINEDRYSQGVVELDSVVFDVESIDRINELRAFEINVRENIDENRNNPF